MLFLIQKNQQQVSVPEWAQLCNAKDRECGIGTRTAGKSGLHIHSPEGKDF